MGDRKALRGLLEGGEWYASSPMKHLQACYLKYGWGKPVVVMTTEQQHQQQQQQYGRKGGRKGNRQGRFGAMRYVKEMCGGWERERNQTMLWSR